MGKKNAKDMVCDVGASKQATGDTVGKDLVRYDIERKHTHVHTEDKPDAT